MSIPSKQREGRQHYKRLRLICPISVFLWLKWLSILLGVTSPGPIGCSKWPQKQVDLPFPQPVWGSWARLPPAQPLSEGSELTEPAPLRSTAGALLDMIRSKPPLSPFQSSIHPEVSPAHAAYRRLSSTSVWCSLSFVYPGVPTGHWALGDGIWQLPHNHKDPQ